MDHKRLRGGRMLIRTDARRVCGARGNQDWIVLTPLASERESKRFRLQITVWTAYPSCRNRTASASAIVVLPAPDGPSNSMIISARLRQRCRLNGRGLYRLFRAAVIQMHEGDEIGRLPRIRRGRRDRFFGLEG